MRGTDRTTGHEQRPRDRLSWSGWSFLRHLLRALLAKRKKTRHLAVTAAGAVTLIVIGIVGYAAINSGANLAYYLLAFLMAGFLTHGIVSPRNLDRIEVQRRLPRRVMVGRPGQMHLVLRNKRRWLPAYGLVVEDYADRRTLVGCAACAKLSASSTEKLAYPLSHPVFQKRGIVALHALVVRSRFPFGFIERSLHFAEPAEVLVLPPTYPIRDNMLWLWSEIGEQASRRRGPGIDLYGLREYVTGEPAKRIHWKTSARAARLMVTENEREEHKRLILYLPTALAAPTAAETADFEHAIVVAASLAATLIRSGFELGLATDEGEIAPESGVSHLERLLRALALIQLTKARAPSWKGSQDATVVILYHDRALRRLENVTAVEDARRWRVADGELIREVPR